MTTTFEIDVKPIARTVLLVGAGFSSPAGVPMQHELMNAALSDLAFPAGYQAVHNVYAGRDQSHPIGIEELLTQADFLETIGTSVPWSSSRISSWLALQILVSGIDLNNSKSVERYKRFMNNALRLIIISQSVITLNWDTIIETLLDSVGFTWHYGKRPLSPTLVSKETELLKLHGSIDWFRLSRKAKPSLPKGALEPVSRGIMRLKRFSNMARRDPLSEEVAMFLDEYSPVIVTPSSIRGLPAGLLRRTWQLAAHRLALAGQVFVVGYSLPEQDVLMQQLLRTSLAWRLNEVREINNVPNPLELQPVKPYVTIIDPDPSGIVISRYKEWGGDHIRHVPCGIEDVEMPGVPNAIAI